MSNRFWFTTCCVQSDADTIIEMVDQSRQITIGTFRRRCNTRDWEASMGYDNYLPIWRDHHVSYYRSRYKGRPCYYAVHSAIEHIFTETGVP